MFESRITCKTKMEFGYLFKKCLFFLKHDCFSSASKIKSNIPSMTDRLFFKNYVLTKCKYCQERLEESCLAMDSAKWQQK